MKKICVEAYNQCNDNVLARLRGHESKAAAGSTQKSTLEVIYVPRICMICLKSFEQFQSCLIIAGAFF